MEARPAPCAERGHAPLTFQQVCFISRFFKDWSSGGGKSHLHAACRLAPFTVNRTMRLLVVPFSILSATVSSHIQTQCYGGCDEARGVKCHGTQCASRVGAAAPACDATTR